MAIRQLVFGHLIHIYIRGFDTNFVSGIFLIRAPTFANIFNVLPYMIVRTVRENRENVIKKKEGASTF